MLWVVLQGQGDRSSRASLGGVSAEGQGCSIGWGAGTLLIREGLGRAETKGMKERERGREGHPAETTPESLNLGGEACGPR